MPNTANRVTVLSLRQAAIVAALTYISNPVTYAEFSIWPRLVVDHDLARTVQNLTAHPKLFVTAILCYLINFIGDIILAWALYYLLAPVNRALSLLASCFQSVFAAMALSAVFNLVTVRNLLNSPDYLAAFGSVQLQAQVLMLLRGFHNDFDFALTVFGLHLLLLGYLVFCSGYIPRLIGLLLALAGLGWIINFVGPYLRPDLNFTFTNILAGGEFPFMIWLLIRSWRLQQVTPPDNVPPATHGKSCPTV